MCLLPVPVFLQRVAGVYSAHWKILGNTLDETLFSLELRRTVTRILLISYSSGGADTRSLPTND